MARTLKKYWPIITFVAGATLGSGAVWQWLDWRLEIQKHELDKVLKAVELRKEIDESFRQLLELSNEFVKGMNEPQPPGEGEARSRQVYARVLLLRDDVNRTEKSLAQIEGRGPRNIQIDWIPPARITDLR